MDNEQEMRVSEVPGVKETWYTRSADVVLEFWETRRDEGLTNKEVAVRREKFGYNEMTAKASTPWWKMLLPNSGILWCLFCLGLL